MGNVVMHNVVSVDGFIANEDDQVGPLFDWYVNGEYGLPTRTASTTGQLKVSKASADYVRPTWAGIGSMVIGRHLFDMTNGWEGRPPTGEHWSWCRTVRSPTGGTPRRRTTLSPTWRRRSRRRRSSRGRALLRWPRATSAARFWRWAWWTRWRWTWCLWSSARVSGTRVGRHPAPARRPRRGHPGRPRAAPALPGSPLTAEQLWHRRPTSFRPSAAATGGERGSRASEPHRA